MFLVPRNLFSHVPFWNDDEFGENKFVIKRRGCRFFFSRFFLGVCVLFFLEGEGVFVCCFENMECLSLFLFNELFVFWLGTKTRGMMRCGRYKIWYDLYGTVFYPCFDHIFTILWRQRRRVSVVFSGLLGRNQDEGIFSTAILLFSDIPTICFCPTDGIHPGRLIWNLKMMVWKMIFLSKWVIFRFQPLTFRGVPKLNEILVFGFF